MKLTLRVFLTALVVLGLQSQAVWGEALDAKEWFMRGNELSRQGQFEGAVQAFQESIKLNSASPAAHYNLGIAYKNLGRLENATQALEETLRLEPPNLDARLSLGNVYNLLERWEEAIGQLNVVVHRRQNDPEAHGNLGWAYYNYKKGPPFKHLVILNLKRAVHLFEQQDMAQAAEATRGTLDEALKKFGYQ